MKSTEAHAFHDVYVNAEALIFKRGRIYPESFALPSYADEYGRSRGYARFLVKNHWLRRGAVSVGSALWVIDNCSNNYFHWMIESLTRLLHAQEWAPDEHILLLPDDYRRLTYVPFTLKAFPQIQRIEWIRSGAKSRVQHLAYIPRMPQQPPMRLPDRADIAEVAARVSQLAGETASARRIYFSRDDALRRRVRNEDEVIRVLRAHDFEIVRTDPAKPWEQIALSRSAEFAVGLHGAALTNLIFMQRGSRLLELRHDRNWDVYSQLADMFSVRYGCQTYTASDTPPAAPGLAPWNTDVIVDLDQLRENLRDDR